MDLRDYLEDVDGKLICKQYYSNKVPVGSEVGCEDGGYRRFKFNGKRYLTHTVLHFLRTGRWIKRLDHKDGDTLNNTDGNLRESSASQNSRNRRSMAGSSSKFLGVSKFRNKWKAQISIENKTTHIGVFDNEEDAARAYDKEAVRVAGEFARVNF